MKIILNKSFPVNVWALSLLIGSILFTLISFFTFFTEEDLSLSWKMVLLLMFFAGVFSWPTFMLCYFLLRYLSKKDISLKSLRLIVYLTAVVGILATSFFFYSEFLQDKLSVLALISYLGALTFSFFRLKVGRTTLT